jgi:aspartate aminotransferase-like enzyme
MDLLINASAREELIVRKHLAKHVSKGWLTFISDELPPENDPLFKVSHSYMTGHIGGSSSLTKKRVAQNTRVLLCELLKANPVFENFSFVNQHLTPRKSWRPGLAEEKEVRILLTDVFDKEALGLEELGRSKGATVRVVDMSHKTPTHQNIAAACKALQPHIIMIRTRTVIDAKMARILTRTPSLRALIRPGVGLDNVHRGIEALSTEGVRIFNEPTGNSFSVGEMTTHFILNGTPKIILAPGPTNIKKEVFAIFDTYTSPHSSQFKTRYTKTLHMLSEWIGRKGEVVMHATPSTGLMEAAITNLTRPGDTGAIIAHGKFGLRFAQIAKASSRESVSLSVGEDSWGQAFSPREISNLFQKASRKGLLIKFLCLQQLETSTGVSYNTQRLRSIIKQARLHNKDMIIIVDGVSATAADPIPYGSLDIDAIVVGSQKAFGLSSGLSFISLSPRAVDRIKKYSTGVPSKHTLYYDMSELLKMQHDHLRLGTPSVFHILSAHTSLSLLMQEGGPRAVAHRHYTLAKMVRAFAKQNNLPLLTQKGYESNAVTAIRLPKPFFAPMIRKRLEQEYGIFLAGAQSEALKPSLIRIGHLGYVTKQDMARCLRSLSIVLREYREQP